MSLPEPDISLISITTARMVMYMGKITYLGGVLGVGGALARRKEYFGLGSLAARS